MYDEPVMHAKMCINTCQSKRETAHFLGVAVVPFCPSAGKNWEDFKENTKLKHWKHLLIRFLTIQGVFCLVYLACSCRYWLNM